MITTLVGKTFLNKYNKETSQNLTAKQFFEQEYFECFFNHPKYMMWVTNSPFVQMKSGQKVETLSIEARKEKLADLHSKVISGSPDASFALGYPASELKEYASTSGLVSDVLIETNEEDIYFSWIGAGLGITVAGGLTILINDELLLWETYLGWKVYRRYLQDPTLEKMRGNQVNTWNGQWITYKFGGNYVDDFDFKDIQDQRIVKVDSSVIEVETVSWTSLFFALSRIYPDNVLNSYIYSFGQTNKTIGFIPFYLKSASRLAEIYEKLFHVDFPFQIKEVLALLGMSIKRACELGNIGLHALRPEGLKKYMNGEKKVSLKKEEDITTYRIYKTWLIAMLSKNKEEVTEYTLAIAKLIQRYRKGAKGTERKVLIETKLFADVSKKTFMNALREMVPGVEPEDLKILKELKDEIHLMTNEEFSYFNTLLRFDYAFVEREV